MLVCQLGDTTGALTGNELACSLWQSGRYEQAIQEWKKMAPGAVKSFNLGMAYLFTGKAAQARQALDESLKMLPDTTGWSHLAQIYRAICN